MVLSHQEAFPITQEPRKNVACCSAPLTPYYKDLRVDVIHVYIGYPSSGALFDQFNFYIYKKGFRSWKVKSQ